MKVTKFSLRHVPNPHTNQVLHEVELWIKDAKGRRRLDLMVKYPIHGLGLSAQRTPSEATLDASHLMEKPANDPVYRDDTKEIFTKTQTSIATRLYSIFQHSSPDLKGFSHFFMDAVRNLHSIQRDMVNPNQEDSPFHVLCHGDLWRQNVLFYYGTSLECQTDCVDVRFEDLHRARYASLVTDILYFLFTTVDFEIRRDHTMDFLAVYYDHFVKNVECESINDLAESDDHLLSSSDILVLQDLFAAGYHSASQERMDECGLDFNHSIMTISRLARFHAVSYAMQGDLGRRMNDHYPFLTEDPVYRDDTKEIFTKTQTSIATRLYSIFQHSSPDLKGFSHFFMDAVRNLHSIQRDMVNPNQEDSPFHVLCHGDLWRQNVLFYYGTSLECQTDCVDVRFEDLHRARYASLVTDILYFLFTTVDFEIRRDHTMDFLAVYYDHFVKSVAKLSPSLSIFTREELFVEFKSKMMYGFLEGICLFSTVYESQIRKLEDEEREHPNLDEGSISGLRPRYSDYKDAVVSMVGDVIRVRFQGEAPPKSALPSSSSPSHPSSGQDFRKSSTNGNGHHD
eukprot:TCALIF_03381-PA protein Name:"Protein of unknown function" AED:0.17 eAED:0.17 QI:0/0.4/0.33/0.66/1/1/6/401/566